MTTTSLQTPPRTLRWNTLQLLQSSRAAILAADVLLLLAVLVGARIHRAAMNTVGRDAAPSIIAAQRIKSSLADMDANAANELLGSPGAASSFSATYDERRIDASQALIDAAKNITYGESEEAPIQDAAGDQRHV